MLRVADFVEPGSTTMLNLALCSKWTFDLLAPLLGSSVKFSQLCPLRRIDKSSRALSRIKNLSMDPPEFSLAMKKTLEISNNLITSLSVTVVNIWQIAQSVSHSQYYLPNLRILSICVLEPVAPLSTFPLQGRLGIISDKELQITELAILGCCNSAVLDRLVEISPGLKKITVDMGMDYCGENVGGEALWSTWDDVGLSDRTCSLIWRFATELWELLNILCRRPAFQPRDVEVYNVGYPNDEDFEEATWRLLASMPQLESFRTDCVRTDVLKLGLPGTKSFNVSFLLPGLRSDDFRAIFDLLHRAKHGTIHMEFPLDDLINTSDCKDEEPLWYFRREREEAAFWRNVRAELGPKVTVDFGMSESKEKEFWEEWLI